MTVARTTIRLPAALMERLRAQAERRHTSSSGIVREALESHLGEKPKWKLPFDYLFDGPEDLTGENIDEELKAAGGAEAIENDR
jgi:hypothetical protein